MGLQYIKFTSIFFFFSFFYPSFLAHLGSALPLFLFFASSCNFPSFFFFLLLFLLIVCFFFHLSFLFLSGFIFLFLYFPSSVLPPVLFKIFLNHHSTELQFILPSSYAFYACSVNSITPFIPQSRTW
jgi:hypothetical protein